MASALFIIGCILWFLFIGAYVKASDVRSCYAAFCDDVISSCRNFENKMINCDGIQFQPTEGQEAMSLNGNIAILSALNDGTTMMLEVLKETELGEEPVSSFAVDMCDSLKNENAPWSGVVKEMQLTGCPIEAGDYYLSNIVLTLGGMQLTQNMCGDYQAKFITLKGTETLSCHVMSLVVREVPCE